MSVSRIIQQAAAGNAGEAIYVDDVFSTYLYDGNATARSIVNGIDLDGEGGLVWTKERSDAANHHLYDTERGALKRIFSNTTDAEQSIANSLTSFNSDGFSLGTGGTSNANGEEYVSWTFRKQPGFFDVVTFSDSGSSQTNRRISHNLGSVPGMIIIKKTSGTGAWFCYHRSTGVDSYLILNMTAAESTGSNFWGTAPTSSDFGINEANLGISGDYVAYLFAHDDSDESIIKCGSYTTDGNEDATIDLGFEPQWLLVKRTDSNLASDWRIIDSMRGWEADGDAAYVEPNTTDAEAQTGDGRYYLTSTGFKQDNFGANRDYVYMAIRRPHKPAEEFAATDLFAVELASNTSAGGKIFTTTFPVDFTIQKQHTVSSNFFVNDRMRDGGNNTAYIQTNTTNAEANFASVTMEFDHMDGVYSTTSFNWSPRIFYALRRAPGFFDVVAYTGTGSARTINHNLGAVPQLMLVKGRNAGFAWDVYAEALGNTSKLQLNLTSAVSTGRSEWNSTTPTDTVFSLGTPLGVNNSGSTYIAYLFASVPGISKVGTYTGTGSAQTIDCGFSNGARFVMIKQTDGGGGDWRVFDTERGIVSGNDPMMALNNTNQSTTYDDYLSPDSSGFALVGNPSNSSGNTFLFLAIA